MSSAIRGGSRSTLSSFSVTIPWYVVSIHGLCLLTVGNRKRKCQSIKTQIMSVLSCDVLFCFSLISTNYQLIFKCVYNNQISSAFSQIASLTFIFPPTAVSKFLMRSCMLLLFLEAPHIMKASPTNMNHSTPEQTDRTTIHIS